MTEELATNEAGAPRGVGQAYVLFVVSLLLVVLIGASIQIASFSIGLAATELLLILLPAILFVRWKKLPLAAALRWRSVPASTVLMSVAAGVTSWGVVAGIMVLTEPLLGKPPQVEGFQPESLPDLLLLYLVAAILPGICEETLFRGAIQGVLRRQGNAKAVVITAVLFAAYHVNPWILLPAFMLGVVFGTLVARTGSSVPAILAHISANATAFTVAYLFRNAQDPAAYPLIGVLAVGFFVVLAVFWQATREVEIEVGVLATIPARLSRPIAWISGIAAGSLVVLAVVAAAWLFTLVQVHKMSSDALAPEIRRGDTLILRKPAFGNLEIEPGDIVSFRHDETTWVREVSRVTGDNVWLLEGLTEVQRPRGTVTGKVVHVIGSGSIGGSGP